MKELRPLKATNQRVTASNGKTTKIFARWQSGLETPLVTECGSCAWKSRHHPNIQSPTSNQWESHNDLDLNHVRTCYLPLRHHCRFV